MSQNNIFVAMVIAFTGHREYDHTQHHDSLRERLIEQLEKSDHEITTLSGMADGFDLSAAETILELRNEGWPIKLHAVVPYRGHEKMIKAQRVYQEVLSAADRVIILEDHYSYGVFLRRNNYLVDNADLVIAYYNNGKKGGTAYTVKRAIKRGISIENIYPQEQLSLF